MKIQEAKIFPWEAKDKTWGVSYVFQNGDIASVFVGSRFQAAQALLAVGTELYDDAAGRDEQIVQAIRKAQRV